MKLLLPLISKNKRAFYVLVVQTMALVVGILLTTFISRTFGPELFGYYSFLLSTVMVCSIFSLFGSNVLVVRDAAVFKERIEWGYIRGLGIFVSSILLFGIVMLAVLNSVSLYVFEYFDRGVSFVLSNDLIFTVVFLSILSLSASFLRGFGSVVTASAADSLFFPLMILVIAFLFYIGTKSLMTASDLRYIMLMSSGVSAVAGLLFLAGAWKWERNPPKATFRIRSWLNSLKYLSPFSLAGIFNDHLGVLSLGYFSDFAEAGYFKIAIQLSILVVFLFNINISIYAPDLAVAHASKDIPALELCIKKIRDTALVWSLSVFFVILIFGEKIVSLITGGPSGLVVPVLLILSLGHVLNVAYGPVVWLLNMAGHESIVSRTFILILVFNSIGCVFLAPKYGAIGLAICFSTTLLLWNLYLSKYCEKFLGVRTRFDWRTTE